MRADDDAGRLKGKSGYASPRTAEGAEKRKWKGGGSGIESKRRGWWVGRGGQQFVCTDAGRQSVRHADLMQRSRAHRSFLSLTIDRCTFIWSPRLHHSSSSFFLFPGKKTGLNRGRFEGGAEGDGGGIRRCMMSSATFKASH